MGVGERGTSQYECRLATILDDCRGASSVTEEALGRAEIFWRARFEISVFGPRGVFRGVQGWRATPGHHDGALGSGTSTWDDPVLSSIEAALLGARRSACRWCGLSISTETDERFTTEIGNGRACAQQSAPTRLSCCPDSYLGWVGVGERGTSTVD